MIGWIIFGVIYFLIAIWLMRIWSYSCIMGMYGITQYSPQTILMGLFWPITLLYLIIGGFFEE